MNDPFDLKPHIGTVQDYPIDGITFRDITTLLETPSAFVGHVMKWLSSVPNSIPPPLPVLKAAALFLESARATCVPLVLARKPVLPNPCSVVSLIWNMAVQHSRSRILP